MELNVWLSIATGLFGGVGLFLYGVKMLSEGMQKAAGDQMRNLLGKLTTNRFLGTGVGALVTGIIQSSTATTVMVVGLVNAGLLNLQQALGVVLGANIGTTLTAQFIAFKISVIALPAIGIGVLMLLFLRNKDSGFAYTAEVVLGVGLLFLGLTIMSEAVIPLRNSPGFHSIFVNFSAYPILAVFVGAALTMILQSSTASIGITIALASAGLLDFQTAVALVLGENIGTTLTANIAAIGGSRAAKQAAFGHFLFNAFGATYMLILLKPYVAFIDFITPGDPAFADPQGTYIYMARHIANAHTFFSLINVAVVLPMLPLLAKACEFFIKSDNEQSYKYTKLSEVLVNTPEIAVSQVRLEVKRMSSVALDVLEDTRDAIEKNDPTQLDKISDYEKTLDGFKRELLRFLDVLQNRSLSGKAQETINRARNVINALEEIGDQAKRIMKITSKMLEKEHFLSSHAQRELDEMLETVTSFASKTFSAFSAGRKQGIGELDMEDHIDKMRKSFRKNHMRRLNDGKCNIETGLQFVDILNCLEKIGNEIFTVAQINAMQESN